MRYPNQLSVIKYQDPATRTYLGSPSILRLDDSNLLVTHDYFGPGCPRNHEGEEHLTSVYRSGDDGRTWTTSRILPGRSGPACSSTEARSISSARRRNTARSSSAAATMAGIPGRIPATSTPAFIARGGPYHDPPNYHCAPVPVLLRGGRLYRAFEDLDPCVWPTGFRSLVISAPEDADLLAAASWTLSNRLAYDPAWTPRAWGGEVDLPGWLEGNIVEAPNGETLEHPPLQLVAARGQSRHREGERGGTPVFI